MNQCPGVYNYSGGQMPIPAVAAASVLHSAAVGGSVIGYVGLLQTFGELNSCELGVFRF